MAETDAFRAGLQIGLLAAVAILRRSRHPALAAMEIEALAHSLNSFDTARQSSPPDIGSTTGETSNTNSTSK